MAHWKIILTYDGTPYNGWQIQPDLPTIQGTLAKAIHQITGEDVLPQGSGRTDAGVHALGQVASFSLTVPIPGDRLQFALNRTLPPSIRILALNAVPESFHARHCARRKTYEYRIYAGGEICSPMLAPWVWASRGPLNLSLLQEAAAHVIGTHDFTSFAASQPDLATRTANAETATEEANNIRTIYRSEWAVSDNLLLYRVTGSGFLHHMVRNLVGTFIEAGSRRIAPENVPSILAARDRSAAGPTAPARGLFLVEVEY